MPWILVFSVIAVFFFFTAIVSRDERGFSIFCFCVALLSGGVDLLSAYDYGQTNVPSVTEEPALRLNTGIAYRLILQTMDVGRDYIVLVKKDGKSDFYALRVKEVPPEYFTFVNSKPVAIVAPSGTK